MKTTIIIDLDPQAPIHAKRHHSNEWQIKLGGILNRWSSAPGSLLARESRIEIRGREAPPEQPVGTTDWLMTKLMFIDPPAPPLPPAIPTVALFARVQFGA